MAAYQRARMAAAEGRFLANRGWTLEQFKASGAKDMLPTTYTSIDLRIAEFDFDASLIIAGFGEGDPGPSVLTIRNPGICIDHTKLGFWAIGSGATLAQTSLFYRRFSWNFSLEKAIYTVYEAKTLAEAAMGVGPDTHIFILRNAKPAIELTPKSLAALREMFEKYKPQDFALNDHHAVAGFAEIKTARGT